jgi:[ribosomal protein S5]-alanine N-acetyltransferase
MPDPLPALHLRTPRLVLRPLKEDDRAAFVRAQEVSSTFWAPWSPAADVDSADALFDRQLTRTLRGLETGKDLRLAAFLDDGRLAALLGLNEIVRGAFHNAYAGWRVAADVVRQGIGTEAVTALLDVAFAPPPCGAGLHRVQANIIPENAPSLRLAEKVGFRREGFARAYLQIAGQWRDHVMFAKVAEEHVIVYPRATA